MCVCVCVCVCVCGESVCSCSFSFHSSSSAESSVLLCHREESIYWAHTAQTDSPMENKPTRIISAILLARGKERKKKRKKSWIYEEPIYNTRYLSNSSYRHRPGFTAAVALFVFGLFVRRGG